MTRWENGSDFFKNFHDVEVQKIKSKDFLSSAFNFRNSVSGVTQEQLYDSVHFTVFEINPLRVKQVICGTIMPRSPNAGQSLSLNMTFQVRLRSKVMVPSERSWLVFNLLSIIIMS